LTSAFDGDVDPKEASRFEELVSQLREHRNPLVSDVFHAASRRLHRDCDALVRELGSQDMMVLPARLLLCRNFVVENYPEQASEFLTVLYDLAQSIANAAGGTFGFGSKVNRSERAALALIAGALGIHEAGQESSERKAGGTDDAGDSAVAR
jgi:hypothetical protein